MQPLEYCTTWVKKNGAETHKKELAKQTWGVNKNPIYAEVIIIETYHMGKVMYGVWARETDDYVEYLRGNRPPKWELDWQNDSCCFYREI